MSDLTPLQICLANMTYDDRMIFATFIAEWLEERRRLQQPTEAADVAEMLSDFYRDDAATTEEEGR